MRRFGCSDPKKDHMLVEDGTIVQKKLHGIGKALHCRSTSSPPSCAVSSALDKRKFYLHEERRRTYFKHWGTER